MGLKNFLSGLSVIIAATIGAGIFALPMIFDQAGWATVLAYLAIFTFALVYAHALYWRTRAAEESRFSLLGLIRKEFGKRIGGVAFLGIVGGLTLTLVVYLILGGNFLRLLFPTGGWSLVIFWFFVSLPLLFGVSGFAALENLGTIVKTGIILLIFFFSFRPGALFSEPSFEAGKIFLPFGIILFALAGWTGIEPAMAVSGERRFSPRSKWLLALGTSFSAALYLLFVMGIFSSASSITPDTISGVLGWPAWKLWTLLVLGLSATWTSYLTISLEIKNSLESGSGWDHPLALTFVIFAPLFLVWAGLTNLLGVIGLAGGIFLSVQYLFIVLLARKKLKLRGLENFASGFLVFIFLAGALYEIYYFVVR